MKSLFCIFMMITCSFTERRVLKISNFIDYIDVEVLKDFVYQNDAKIKDKNDLLNTIAYPNQKNLLNSEILLDNKDIYMNIMENFKNFKKEYIKNKDLNEK